jgi:hypothetical protein
MSPGAMAVRICFGTITALPCRLECVFSESGAVSLVAIEPKR